MQRYLCFFILSLLAVLSCKQTAVKSSMFVPTVGSTYLYADTTYVLNEGAPRDSLFDTPFIDTVRVDSILPSWNDKDNVIKFGEFQRNVYEPNGDLSTSSTLDDIKKKPEWLRFPYGGGADEKVADKMLGMDHIRTASFIGTDTFELEGKELAVKKVLELDSVHDTIMCPFMTRTTYWYAPSVGAVTRSEGTTWNYTRVGTQILKRVSVLVAYHPR